MDPDSGAANSTINEAPNQDTWSGAEFLRAINGMGSRFPPIRVLYLAHRIQASGRVELLLADGWRQIGLRRGRINQAVGFRQVATGLNLLPQSDEDLASMFGRALAAGGSPDQLLRSCGGLLGEVLVRLSPDRVRMIRFLEEEIPGTPVPLPASIPTIVAEGVGRLWTTGELVARWGPLGRQRVELQLPTDAPEPSWGLPPIAHRILRELSRGATLIDAVGGGRGSTEAAWQAFELLRLLGFVVPPTAAEAREATEDPHLSELLARLARMQELSPVDLMGIDAVEKANPAGVEQAFREASVHLHPDRFAGRSPAMQEAAAACFTLLAEAREALAADPEILNELRERLRASADGRVWSSDAEKLRARTLVKKAEYFLRKQQYDEALHAIDESLLLLPGDFQAAFLRCQTLARSGKLAVDPLVAAFDALVPSEPNDRAEIHFEVGEALFKAGRAIEALKRFERAVAANEEHIGARRRLRLNQMRGKKTDAEPESSAPRGLAGFFRRRS